MTAEDPTTEEDPMTDEDPMTEEPGTEEDDPATETDDTTTDEGQVPVFVGTVTIEVINGSVTITGEVLVPDGSSPTITFGGALSGLSATIGADGSFTLTASSSTTGVGTISLLDDDGFMVDFQTVLL